MLIEKYFEYVLWFYDVFFSFVVDKSYDNRTDVTKCFSIYLYFAVYLLYDRVTMNPEGAQWKKFASHIVSDKGRIMYEIPTNRTSNNDILSEIVVCISPR